MFAQAADVLCRNSTLERQQMTCFLRKMIPPRSDFVQTKDGSSGLIQIGRTIAIS
jgi:hypothetical protein